MLHVDTRPTRLSRDFHLLWAASTISYVGDGLLDTTVMVWIALTLAAHQPWAPLAIAGVVGATTLPTLLIGTVAGTLVDRWPRRRTLRQMDALRAFLIVLLAPLPWLGWPPMVQIGMLYLVLLGASSATQFFTPARVAVIGDLVPEPERARATSRSQTTQMLAALLAPPLATTLFVAIGPAGAIVLDALTFILSFVLLTHISTPDVLRTRPTDTPPRLGREFREGLHFIRHSRVLNSLIIAMAITMLGGGMLSVVQILFALHNLHLSVALYGWMLVSLCGGLVCGSSIAGLVVRHLGAIGTLIGALFADALVLVIYARSTTFAPACILIGLAGFFQAMINVPVWVVILRVTPRSLIGRVVGMLTPITALMTLIGSAGAGVLTTGTLVNWHLAMGGIVFGPYDLAYTIGATLILLSALMLFARIGVRDPLPVRGESWGGAA